ncbi:MAG: hypothetical protein E6K46_12730 [Gammaproteobacteria bacterium]|nr:MAG: hypothetical protein E6K46_12730 [Gammaproteobacteria bacterium]
MSSAPWTVGRYVVETLAANGVDTVFGIPGVHNIELYRGLEWASPTRSPPSRRRIRTRCRCW